MDLHELKAAAAREVDRLGDRLRDLALRIHDNPELSFQEYKAAEWITSELESLGFQSELGIAQLPTAFKAWADGAPGGPTIAVQAEMDALPDIGHACGHNIIAAGAVGAAAAVKAVMGDLPGRIAVMGTPAEEGGGGKILMVERGAYDDVDVALYIHPQTHTAAMGPNNAAGSITVRFHGVPASATGGKAPEGQEHLGASAVNGIIAVFNNVNTIRQHIQRDVIVRGIITKGGTRRETVPLLTECWFSVRGPDHLYLREILERIEDCARAAALATGTEVELERGPLYAERVTIEALKSAMAENMRRVGLPDVRDDLKAASSTDSGNVSQVIPLAAGRIAVADPTNGMTLHSAAFAEATGSERAMEAALSAAKVLAWTALDILTTPELLEASRQEFRAKTGREPGQAVAAAPAGSRA